MKPLKASLGLYVGAGLALVSMVAMPLIASAESLTRQLEYGMSGADVSVLQTFLARDTSIYPEGLVTGYFGSLTKAAVSNFQARNGIAVVGRVGPVTMAAINAQMGGGSTVGWDRRAPTIYSLNVNPGSSSATLTWNTDEGASGIIYYSGSPLVVTEANATMGVNVSGATLLTSTDLRTSHSGTLTGLSANATYYYVVYVRDASGNVSVSPQSTFKTAN